MSISVINTVWAEFDGDAHTLLLALALADYADDWGGSIFAAVPTIAAKVRKDERTTRRQIRALELAGWLVRVGRAPGPYSAVEYRINPDWLAEHAHRFPADPRGQRGHGARSRGGRVPPPVGASGGASRAFRGGTGAPQSLRDPLTQEAAHGDGKTEPKTAGIVAAEIRERAKRAARGMTPDPTEGSSA